MLEGMANLDKGYGQVGGRWSGDEWLANTDPTQGTELCDIEELLFSLEKNFEILGEPAFADRIEQLILQFLPCNLHSGYVGSPIRSAIQPGAGLSRESALAPERPHRQYLRLQPQP